jgi:hypothetical protein
MKYLLSIFGQVKNDESGVERMAKKIVDVSDSKNVKFSYGESSSIFHFKSNEDFYKLKQFIHSVVSNECIIYMLVPYEGEISCQMPTQIFEHLFDLEDDGIGFLDNYNNVNPELQQDYDTINEILSLTKDDYEETIIPEKALSLDEILEKISNKGIESLTKKEKQTLHQYSK